MRNCPCYPLDAPAIAHSGVLPTTPLLYRAIAHVPRLCSNCPPPLFLAPSPADVPELLEAQKVKARLLEEQAVEGELVRAADSSSLSVVEAALAKAAAIGITV